MASGFESLALRNKKIMTYIDRFRDYYTPYEKCLVYFHWTIYIVMLLTLGIFHNIEIVPYIVLVFVFTKELHSSVYYDAKEKHWNLYYGPYNYTSFVAILKHQLVKIENKINSQ